MKVIWKFFNMKCGRDIEFRVVFLIEIFIKSLKMILKGKFNRVTNLHSMH